VSEEMVEVVVGKEIGKCDDDCIVVVLEFLLFVTLGV